MRNRQHLAQAALINIHSEAFACIQLPADYGSITAEELYTRYEENCMNIPREHLESATTGANRQSEPTNARPFGARPVRPNASAGLRGARQVVQFLYDQLTYLKSIIEEIYSLQDALADALGGFYTDEIDTYEIAGFDPSLPVKLTPTAAYYLRVIVRFRMAQVDFEYASGFVEEVFEALGRVHRGTRASLVDMSRSGLDELAMQWRAWESVYLDISLDFFELANGFSEIPLFYKDQQTIREFKRRIGGVWPSPPITCHGTLCS